MPGRQVNTKFTEREIEDLRAAAAERGESVSDVIRGGAMTWAGFDSTVIARLHGYSMAFGVPVYIVLQNMIIDRMAKEAAELEIYGPSTRILSEFLAVGGETLTGQALFETLRGQYVKDLARERVEALHEKARHKALSPEELEFIRRHAPTPSVKGPHDPEDDPEDVEWTSEIDLGGDGK